jgi:hypothetical protein
MAPDRRASRPTTKVSRFPPARWPRNVAKADVNFTTSRGLNPSPGRPPIVPRIPDIDLIKLINYNVLIICPFFLIFAITHLRRYYCPAQRFFRILDTLTCPDRGASRQRMAEE